MGRHREFDPERALEAAMELFWQQGYQHTSIEDLLGAMKINRWSLYETFGNKPQLFLKALNLYRGRWQAFIAEHLRRPGSPRAALVSLVREMGREIVHDRLARGCLIANSHFELKSLEPDAQAVVLASVQGLEDALASTIHKAQEAGELRESTEPRVLARFLIASLNGIRGVGKVEAQRARLADLIEVCVGILQ
jgi:TetR/AcrR family transcriptional repressor of nem operon